ncbi:GntR family transcriptional regulator [Marinobacteraceae bacterium S3BR75-40.1]
MENFKARQTLTEQVAEHLENQIAFGRLAPGERIHESKTAKLLGVSHGSVREALLVLEKRHLVRNVPRRGSFVTELDAHFVKSLYETLTLYLSHNARRLITRYSQADMDRLLSLYDEMQVCFKKGDIPTFLQRGIEYVQISLNYADNYFVTSALRDLWPSAKRCAFLALRQGNQVLDDTLEHMRISLEALEARDETLLISNLEDYANQQCQQVIAALPDTDKAGD